MKWNFRLLRKILCGDYFARVFHIHYLIDFSEHSREMELLSFFFIDEMLRA